MIRDKFEMRAIGDLSLGDRAMLRELAIEYSDILEGGVGASTQILTHFTAGTVVSYDTDEKWIERVRDVLFPKMKVEGECEFRLYTPETEIDGHYDLAFVDLHWPLRLEFAKKAWERLLPAGVLVFHDARRAKDIENFKGFFGSHYFEIEKVDVCPNDSNLILITKRPQPINFVDWHKKEKWTPKQLGIDWLQEQQPND